MNKTFLKQGQSSQAPEVLAELAPSWRNEVLRREKAPKIQVMQLTGQHVCTTGVLKKLPKGQCELIGLS